MADIDLYTLTLQNDANLYKFRDDRADELVAADIDIEDHTLMLDGEDIAGLNGKVDKSSVGVANGVASLDQNGQVPTSQLPDELDISTETITGNPISFNTLTAQNAESTEVGIEPIQDLHGYTKPWVGGAGKNLLPLTVQAIKDANTSGTWSGNVYTYDGMTYTLLTDSDNNITGIKLKRSATGAAYAQFIINYSLAAGSYIVNSEDFNGSSSIYVEFRDQDSTRVTTQGEDETLTITSQTDQFARIIIGKEYDPDNVIAKPMIRLSTVSDATFEPYTNICSIFPGVYGKNLFEPTNQLTGCTLQNGIYTLNTVPSSDISIVIGDITLSAGDYLLSGGYSSTFRIFISINSVTYVSNSNTDVPFTVSTSGTYTVSAVILSTATVGTKIKPMIRLASVIDNSFEPYDTHKIEIIGNGKNLVEGEILTGSIDIYGTIMQNNSYKMNIAQVKKNVTYTITSDELFTGGFFWSFPSMGSISYDNQRLADASKTFTAPIDGYVAFRTSLNYATPQIEFGETATTYEPYNPNTDILLETGQDVYGGKFIPETGVLTVTHKVLDLGTKNYNFHASTSANDTNRFSITPSTAYLSDAKVPSSTTVANIICETYAPSSNTANVTNDPSRTGYVSLATGGNVVITDTRFTDTTTFKTAMSGVKLVYELATPLTIQLTPQQIALLKGYNYLSTNCQSLDLTYRIGEMATLNDIKGLDDKIVDLQKNSIGDAISLTTANTSESNKYVFPQNGYVYLNSSEVNTGTIAISVYGSNDVLAFREHMIIVGTQQRNGIYVIKGMKCYVSSLPTGTSVTFRPLI